MEGDRNHSRMDVIVRAAVKLFAEKGYHATTISDITEAVGLGRGALYYHIGSKEALLLECHNRFVDPMVVFANEIERQPLSPAEKLRAISRRLVEVVTTYQPDVIVFYREMGALSPDRLAVLIEKRRSFEDAIERVIRQGIERGDWVPEDPRMCVLAFLGMHNWIFQWYNPLGRLRPDEIADIFIRLFLKGLEKRSDG